MDTHSSVLAWRMDRGSWRATVRGVAESDTTERLTNILMLRDRSFISLGIQETYTKGSTHGSQRCHLVRIVRDLLQ